jgi:hypothetical protein
MPLELFCEAHLDDLAKLSARRLPARAPGPPETHADAAGACRERRARRHDAETPWGARSVFRLLGHGQRLTDRRGSSAQARLLVPLAVSHTRGLLLHSCSGPGPHPAHLNPLQPLPVAALRKRRS